MAPVTPLVLAVCHHRRPERHRRLRTALAAPTAVALVGYLAPSTAPPRLLHGDTDVLAGTADLGWWSSHGSAVRGASQAVDDLAAMPSVHVGWALWCALVVHRLSRRRWLGAAASAYPLGTTVVLVATANHWLLDAVVGAAL